MDWEGRKDAGLNQRLSAPAAPGTRYAGKLFREMMEQQKLYAASGHFRPLVTYHGPQGGQTSIDFMVLPQSYVGSITGALALFHSGRTLQHAAVRRPLDHDPILVRFAYAPDMFRPPQPEQPRLDMDLLRVAMKTGYRREAFINKVEEGAKEAATRHPPHSTMADSKWEDIIQILQNAAGECYTQGPRREQIDGYTELVTAREAALKHRRKIRMRLVQLGKEREASEDERRKAQAEQCAAAWKLKELTRKAQGLRRRWEKIRRATLEEELQDAARTGRLAMAYKISRQLSGRRGPKNRSHRSIRRLQTAQEWRSELGEPGPRGGMGAEHCSFSEELDKWKQSATWEEKEELDANALYEAKELFFSLIKRFIRCDKRRVAPPWSVPNEVWIQALLPNWRYKKDYAVGAVNQKIGAPMFVELLTRTLAQTIATCQTPLQAHRSQGADVAKPNGKLRLLHVLCPFWTQVYSRLRYHNELQAADSARREQLGPPHVHVFGAMITALITQITRITPHPSSLDFLKQIATWLNASPLSAVMEMVTVARLSRTRQPNQTRVQIRVNRESYHQSGAVHSRHAPHVRDGPAVTPRALAVEASGRPTDTGVILPALSAETRLHMKRAARRVDRIRRTGHLHRSYVFSQSVRDSSLYLIPVTLSWLLLSCPLLLTVSHILLVLSQCACQQLK